MAQPVTARVTRVSVAAKNEVTYGTDPVLAAADIIAARNPVWRPIIEQFRDERSSGLAEMFPDIPGARSKQLTVEFVDRGFGSAYSAANKPPLGVLLRMCGLSEVGSFVAGLENYKYEKQAGATMGESGTIAVFSENAPQSKLTGAFGTGRFLFRSGQPLVFSPTFSGLYNEPSDVALITAAVPTVISPIFASGAVTVDAVLRDVSSMELDLGAQVEVIPSANPASAIEGFHIVNHRITLTLDPRQTTVATYNWLNKLTTAAKVVASWQVGTAQYNRVKFVANQLQVTEITEVVRNGLKAFQATCLLNPGALPPLTITYD